MSRNEVKLRVLFVEAIYSSMTTYDNDNHYHYHMQVLVVLIFMADRKLSYLQKSIAE